MYKTQAGGSAHEKPKLSHGRQGHRPNFQQNQPVDSQRNCDKQALHELKLTEGKGEDDEEIPGNAAAPQRARLSSGSTARLVSPSRATLLSVTNTHHGSCTAGVSLHSYTAQG